MITSIMHIVCLAVLILKLSVRAQIPLFIDIKNSLFGHGNKLSG